MPIGKDSIKTRVAKVTPAEETPKVEAPVEEKPAPKKPATRKPSAPKTPKVEGEAVAAAPKAPRKRTPSESRTPKAQPPVETPAVDTAVLGNVSPETVAAVIGHDEKKPSDKVQIGQKLPRHLL